MAKKHFHCRDAGFQSCDFVAEGETTQEILQKAGVHAQQAHGLTVTPELAKKVEGLIHGPEAHGKKH